MSYYSLYMIAALILLLSQLSCSTPQPGNMPRCAFDCMNQLLPQTGCDSGNLPCYCNNATNLALLENCVETNCTGGFGGFGGGGNGQGSGSFFSQFICSNLIGQITTSGALTAGSTDTLPTTGSNIASDTTSPQNISPNSEVSTQTTISGDRTTDLTTTSNINPLSTKIEQSIATTPTATNTTEPPTTDQNNKPLAPIIAGVVGGVSVFVCITAIAIYKIRKHRRKKRALKRLEALQGSNFLNGDAYDVNGIVGTGIDDTSQGIWSGGPVTSFIPNGKRRVR
ncbi:hypothetical protein AA313_de0203915 [Arthrobotrys entomopaga]|nr:hypothetical protein AA313_de0203915 [Arthrobotrys entomopaga]